MALDTIRLETTETQLRDVAKGTLINLFSNLGKLSNLVFDLIATRFMGQEIFGYFSTTWMIMHLAFTVCYFGGHRLIIDWVVQSREKNNEEYYRGILAYVILSFLLSALLVIFTYLFASDIAALTSKPALEQYLKILVWSAPFYCFSTILMTATRGLKIMKWWVLVRHGAEPLMNLIGILILFFVFSLIEAPVAAKALGFAGGAVVAVVLYRRHFSIRKIWQTWPRGAFWKPMATFGLPVMMMELLSIVVLKVDIIPLSLMASASLVGLYQIILNIGNVMRNIPQSMDPILMPVVVQMRIRKDITALENIYVTLFRVNILLSFGFFILVAVFGDLLLMIFGESFLPGTTACTIACFGIMLNTIFSSAEPALIMFGYPYSNLLVNIFFVVTNLILDFILIPVYGLMGAALGSVSACTLTAVLQAILIRRILKIHPYRWDFLNIIAFGLLMWIGFAVIRFLLFETGIESYGVHAMGILIFIMIYLYIGWKRFLTPSDRKIFSFVGIRSKQSPT